MIASESKTAYSLYENTLILFYLMLCASLKPTKSIVQNFINSL